MSEPTLAAQVTERLAREQRAKLHAEQDRRHAAFLIDWFRLLRQPNPTGDAFRHRIAAYVKDSPQ